MPVDGFFGVVDATEERTVMKAATRADDVWFGSRGWMGRVAGTLAGFGLALGLGIGGVGLLACSNGGGDNGANNGSGGGSGAAQGGSGNAVVNLPQIVVDPGSVSVNLGIPTGQEQTYSFTVKNTGSADLEIYEVRLDYQVPAEAQDDPDEPAFRLTAVVGCYADGDCPDTLTPPDGSAVLDTHDAPLVVGADSAGRPGEAYQFLQVQVTFRRPATTADRQVSVTISSNADNAPTLQVPFNLGAVAAAMSIAPSIVDFQQVQAGETKKRQIGINNVGSDVLKIYKFEFVGSDYFRLGFEDTDLADHCPSEGCAPGGEIGFSPALEIAPGQSMVLDVFFAPQDGSPASATLTVFSNDPQTADTGVEVTIQGNTSGPCIQLNPDHIEFGGRPVGTPSKRKLQILSCGNEPLVITGFDWAEGSSAAFTINTATLPGFEDGSMPSVENPLIIPVNAKVELEVRYIPEQPSPKGDDGQPIPDEATLLVHNNSFDGQAEVSLTGVGLNSDCPVPVINIVEGEEVIPQTELHLYGEQSFSPNGDIVEWTWSVKQPVGSASVFQPNAKQPNVTFTANVAGTYVFFLEVRDSAGKVSCQPAQKKVVVIPEDALHVELLWDTPSDPDQTDEGPYAGSDLDLHFLHEFAAGPDLDGDGEPDGWFDTPFDCFWFNPNPDWGSLDPNIDDNPRLDRDDTDGAGPENLNLSVPETDRRYRVGVHYWNAHGFGESFATVRIYVYGQLVWERSDVKLQESDMWCVADILHWPTVEIQECRDAFGNLKITPNYTNPFFNPNGG